MNVGVITQDTFRTDSQRNCTDGKKTQSVGRTDGFTLEQHRKLTSLCTIAPMGTPEDPMIVGVITQETTKNRTRAKCTDEKKNRVVG